MGKEADLPPAVSVGKELDLDPTHGHTRVMPGEKNEDHSDKRSFEQVVSADASTGISPEAVLAMDNIPDDLHEIEKLLGLNIGDKTREKGPPGDAPAHAVKETTEEETPAAAVEVTPAADTTPADKPAAAASTAAPAAAKPTDGEFVESRDGKGRIPYSVLADTRRQNAAMAAELAALKAGAPAATGTPAAAPATAAQNAEATAAAAKAQDGTLTDEQIDALSEKFPEELVSAIKALNITAKTALGKVTEIETEANDLERQDLAQSAQTVQDLIDADPVLSKWQNAEDHADWDEAVRLDESLRQTRLWGGKPATERFAEVKRMMGVAPTAVTPPPAAAKTSTLTPEKQAQARLDEAAAKAAKGRSFSHSDLPGGSPPAQSERETLANTSVLDLAKSFESMTPAKQREYLARVG